MTKDAEINDWSHN